VGGPRAGGQTYQRGDRRRVPPLDARTPRFDAAGKPIR